MATWLVGFALSLFGGGVAAWAFLAFARRVSDAGSKPESGARRVRPVLTGVVERTFFTFLVAFNVSGYATAMIGWLALKLATNWNHPAWKDSPAIRTHGLLALLAGLISMLFAFIGGSICNGSITVGT